MNDWPIIIVTIAFCCAFYKIGYRHGSKDEARRRKHNVPMTDPPNWVDRL